MAFFDVPRDEDITPEARQWLDELKRLRGIDTIPRSWMAYAGTPRILEARRCDGCFGASRIQLTSLGFDEPALDGFCANPAVLPLPERERAFVKYVLRIATDPSELQPKDFHEMQAQGLSADDVRDIAGFAAWAVMNTIFTTVANTGLQED